MKIRKIAETALTTASSVNYSDKTTLEIGYSWVEIATLKTAIGTQTMTLLISKICNTPTTDKRTMKL